MNACRFIKSNYNQRSITAIWKKKFRFLAHINRTCKSVCWLKSNLWSVKWLKIGQKKVRVHTSLMVSPKLQCEGVKYVQINNFFIFSVPPMKELLTHTSSFNRNINRFNCCFFIFKLLLFTIFTVMFCLHRICLQSSLVLCFAYICMYSSVLRNYFSFTLNPPALNCNC